MRRATRRRLRRSRLWAFTGAACLAIVLYGPVHRESPSQVAPVTVETRQP